MNKKNIFLISFGIFVIVFFLYALATDFNFYTLANDSGFDTSYDGGGSSSSSSWDSDYSSGGGSSDMDPFGFWENLFFGIFGIFVVWMIKPKRKAIQIILTIVISLLALLRLLGFIFYMGIALGVILFIPALFIGNLISSRKQKKRYQLNLNVKPEDKPLLDEGYKIFYGVQMAWMNFDYDKLRELVTDELYNMYYNQLQTLSLKGQKNIMSDFELIGYRMVSNRINKKGIKTLKMELNVKFYDHIADQNNKKVRGFTTKKVNMTYELVFVYDENAINTCPSCSAPLESCATVCSYCHTHIQSTRSKMKLSNKKVLYQR